MQRGVRTLLARRAAARAEAAAVVLQVRWQPQYICCGTHAMPDPIPLFPAMCIPFKSTLYMVARVTTLGFDSIERAFGSLGFKASAGGE